MRVTSRSPIEIDPAFTASSPAMHRRSVLLPQPDGPTTTSSSPGSASSVDAGERLYVAEALVHPRDDEAAHRPSHPAPRSSCRKNRWATANAATTGAVATTAPASSTG